MPSLIWVYPGSLARDLHRASRLETATELARLGWDVTFVAAEVSHSELGPGVHAVVVRRPAVYLAGYLIFYARLLRAVAGPFRHADVVLCSPESAPCLLPVTIVRKALRWPRPLFVVDWRTVVMNAGYSTRGKLWNAFYWLAHVMANHLADGQTAITRRLADAVGIGGTQLLGVWPSGVRVEKFRGALDNRRWPEDGEPLRLIYVGVLEAERNLLALCDAVEIVRAEGLNVELDLVGDGPQRVELEQYVSQLGDEAIKVLPPVGRDEVPKVLSDAHIGVLPFPDKQQFRVSSPIKLFEYMAAGMPILATRIVCHTDVLGNDEAVFWAIDGSPEELAAAVRCAWGRRMDLKENGERVSGVAEKWTWQASAKLFDAALRRALKRATPRGTRAVAKATESHAGRDSEDLLGEVEA